MTSTTLPDAADPDIGAAAVAAPPARTGGGAGRGRWSGPLLAALVVLAAALPGLARLPPLDRDESRFAEATAQMLETRDFVNTRYLGVPRDKKPVGIHWLQAASVALVSPGQVRAIWAYRLPSLLGAMLAAAACCWGAQPFWRRPRALLAGAILGASFILSSEAFIAKTDAVLCGATTLSMAALARLYGAGRGVGRPKTRYKALFWIGQGVAMLDKGPIAPMVAALAIAALWAMDREARWARRLGWGWGLLIVLAIVGPWAVAITVATDGRFWSGAVGGDLAPKLRGGHESHGAPPGLHLLLSPLLLFPATLLLPAALSYGRRAWREPGTRFALAWLVPTWLVFEALPTKLVHYTLPAYGALAWLAAAATAQPVGRISRWSGAALSALAGFAYAVVAIIAARSYGADGSGTGWAWVAAGLALAAGLAGALALTRRAATTGLLAAGGLGVLAHGALAGGEAPRLARLWTSPRAAALVARARLDPRNGVTPGPLAVAGYAEPSLVFLLGTDTDLVDGARAADDVADGQPALVEARQATAFRAELAHDQTTAVAAGSVRGYDYSVGKPVELTLWRAQTPPAALQEPAPP